MGFESGEKWTGNSQGRPPGSGYRQKIFNDLVLPHKEALIEKALSLAKDGDPQMLKLFLERLLPPRPIDEPLPPLTAGKIGHEKNRKLREQIAGALKDGEITPAQAQAALKVLNDALI